MAKNIFVYVYLLLLFGCVPVERNINVKPKEVIVPLEITKTDTIYITVDIPMSIGKKYEAALRKYIGLKEATGHNDGAAIALILRNCGVNIPAPWCACYLNQGLLDIGLNGGPAYQPAYTPRWFEDPDRIRWIRDKSSYEENWKTGWIGGIYFRSLGRIGHVACIIDDFNDGYVLTIEGNTNAQGGREGNGVYLRIRSKSEFYMVADWLTNNGEV